jgi:hypothetical protein
MPRFRYAAMANTCITVVTALTLLAAGCSTRASDPWSGYTRVTSWGEQRRVETPDGVVLLRPYVQPRTGTICRAYVSPVPGPGRSAGT